jgi:transcriptional regulatory protein LevR
VNTLCGQPKIDATLVVIFLRHLLTRLDQMNKEAHQKLKRVNYIVNIHPWEYLLGVEK